MPRAWYSFNNIAGLLPDASGNWTKLPRPTPGFPRFNCAGVVNQCAIYAAYALNTTAPDNPVISENISNYIIAAQSSSVPKLPATGIPYLYKKP